MRQHYESVLCAEQARCCMACTAADGTKIPYVPIPPPGWGGGPPPRRRPPSADQRREERRVPRQLRPKWRGSRDKNRGEDRLLAHV